MKKRTRIYNIYYSVVSYDFVTPACSVVMFSNVPINSSLEAGIVLRQINAKDCPPTDTQRDVVTRVNKGCCARCTTHVARMTCMEKKSLGFFDGNWSSGTRSSDYFLHSYGYARYSNVDTNYASECNYNFIQINFEGKCFILLITSFPRKRPSEYRPSLSFLSCSSSAGLEFWTFR